jgi:hypothetical protein
LVSADAPKEVIDIAKTDFGSKALSKKIIDNDPNTVESVTSFNVKFPINAKLDKVEIKFVPSNGKVRFKAIKDGKEILIYESDITEKDESVSFVPNDKDQFLEIKVEWIPNNPTEAKLMVREFSALTSDKATVATFREIAVNVAKDGVNANTRSDSAGAEVSAAINNTNAVPIKLPTEYAVSSATLPETRPVSK